MQFSEVSEHESKVNRWIAMCRVDKRKEAADPKDKLHNLLVGKTTSDSFCCPAAEEAEDTALSGQRVCKVGCKTLH